VLSAIAISPANEPGEAPLPAETWLSEPWGRPLTARGRTSGEAGSAGVRPGINY